MTEPSVPTPKPIRRNADQDQEIADFNIASAQYLDTVLNNPEICTALATRGYTKTRLAEGQTKQQQLQAAITHRQTMLGQQDTAVAGLTGSGDLAYQTFKDYRNTVQAIAAFTAADRRSLGAAGVIYKDKQKFINQATSAYQNAALPAYATTLAEFGYPAAVLTTALATLHAYSQADTDQNSIGGDATKATTDRNAAYQELKTYMKQLKGIAKVALRTRPDLLKKLQG